MPEPLPIPDGKLGSEQLQKAVDKVGNGAAAVRKELGHAESHSAA